ncbi:MAG: hypothetical protein R3B84_01735 [Zavarzinella sp.]
MPADFEFVASCSSSSHALAEIPSQLIPPILKNPLTNHFEVAWVRARIPSVFKITPDPTEIEKTVLFMGFVAAAENKMEGVPFWCSDYYGRTSLTFSEEESDESLKDQVANAYWGLLLAEPEILQDFDVKVMHMGANVTLHFGCEDGEPFLREIPD